MKPVRIQPLTEQNERKELQTAAPVEDELTPATPPKESFFGEIFRFAIIALVVVVPFRMFVAQPFIVSGASMSPTFESGQYLIVDQLSYRFESPQRGDVVIFRFPEDTSKFFIKRIIGLPGETIELRGVDVIVKGRDGSQVRLDEPYLRTTNVKDDFLTITLKEREYFVMGDNRSASSDSRIWGAVPEELIVGRAFVRLLPVATAAVYPGAYELPRATTSSHDTAD